MSWESDFFSQWQTFLNTVETQIRKEIKTNGKLNLSIANTVIQKEIAKWSISSHFNGAWLRNLRIQSPSLAEEFQTTLEEIQLDKSILLKHEIPTLYAAIVVGVIVTTFFVIGWQDESIIRQLLGTGTVAVIAIPIFTNLWSNRKKKAVDKLIKQLRQELEATGIKLRSIAAKADKEG